MCCFALEESDSWLRCFLRRNGVPDDLRLREKIIYGPEYALRSGTKRRLRKELYGFPSESRGDSSLHTSKVTSN